jgi:glyoxylase-like metal-dependent hydrolase (beta-lactamase superfamily II)
MSKRWFLLFAAAASAAACMPETSAPKQELKDIRSFPRFFSQEIVTRRKVAGLDLKIYDTGSVTVPGDLISEVKSPQSRVKLSIPVFVLRHPTQGLVLFDAGLPPVDADRRQDKDEEFGAPFESAPGQDLVAQLRRDQIKPEDVRWIILSDLHWEHVGRLDAFPAATVVVDRREWEAQVQQTKVAAGPEEFDPAAMEPKLRLRLLDMARAPYYGVFDYGLDLFKDGSVIVLDLSGHRPGGLGLWINLDSGPVLLAGDASYVLDNCQDLALPKRQTMSDPGQYWRKLNMMNQMAKELPQLVIFPGHDLMPLKIQPRPDISLAP